MKRENNNKSNQNQQITIESKDLSSQENQQIKQDFSNSIFSRVKKILKTDKSISDTELEIVKKIKTYYENKYSIKAVAGPDLKLNDSAIANKIDIESDLKLNDSAIANKIDIEPDLKLNNLIITKKIIIKNADRYQKYIDALQGVNRNTCKNQNKEQISQFDSGEPEKENLLGKRNLENEFSEKSENSCSGDCQDFTQIDFEQSTIN